MMDIRKSFGETLQLFTAMLRHLLSSLPATACRLPAARPGKAFRRAAWWRPASVAAGRRAARGVATAAGRGGGEAEGEERLVSEESEEESEEDDTDNSEEDDEAPFPRIGWTPGSLGARALRPSRKRGPGEATGRTKPPRWENDYWHEAGVYDDPKK
jgi:hypothetical protein